MTGCLIANYWSIMKGGCEGCRTTHPNVIVVGGCRRSGSPGGKILLLENNLGNHLVIHSWIKILNAKF